MNGKCIECGQTTPQMIPTIDGESMYLCGDCDMPKTPQSPSPATIVNINVNRYATMAFWTGPL